MKATLEFNLPKEQAEYLQAIHAGDMRVCLTDLALALRGHIKHGAEPPTIEEIYQDINEVLSKLEA